MLNRHFTIEGCERDSALGVKYHFNFYARYMEDNFYSRAQLSFYTQPLYLTHVTRLSHFVIGDIFCYFEIILHKQFILFRMSCTVRSYCPDDCQCCSSPDSPLWLAQLFACLFVSFSASCVETYSLFLADRQPDRAFLKPLPSYRAYDFSVLSILV